MFLVGGVFAWLFGTILFLLLALIAEISCAADITFDLHHKKCRRERTNFYLAQIAERDVESSSLSSSSMGLDISSRGAASTWFTSPEFPTLGFWATCLEGEAVWADAVEDSEDGGVRGPTVTESGGSIASSRGIAGDGSADGVEGAAAGHSGTSARTVCSGGGWWRGGGGLGRDGGGLGEAAGNEQAPALAPPSRA